jgi:hypothetical protein
MSRLGNLFPRVTEPEKCLNTEPDPESTQLHYSGISGKSGGLFEDMDASESGLNPTGIIIIEIKLLLRN